jgi:folate-binding protein YgfZ
VTDHDAFARELAALRAGRGFVDVSDRRVVRVGGGDAVGWLHDLLTADIAGLPPGAACRSLLLSPTGHVRADVQVIRRADDVLLVQDEAQPDDIRAALTPYVLSSDVALDDASGDLVILALPHAAGFPGGTTGAMPSCLGPGVDVIGPAADAPVRRAALEEAGFLEVHSAAAEAWRILEGRPRMGAEFDQRSLPAEARLDGLIDTTKGCFLGQESVARVRNLGHPPRVLRHVQGSHPLDVGAPVRNGDAIVGAVTSVAWIEDRYVALVRTTWAAATTRLADTDGHPLTDVASEG